MVLPIPLNNNCLVEILDEYEGIYRDSTEESVQKGRLISYYVFAFHITASSTLSFSDAEVRAISDWLDDMKGKIVYWQEFADSGQKFEQDGKKYALVPFWRLTAFEGEENE